MLTKDIEQSLEPIEMDIESHKIKIQLSYSSSKLSILIEEKDSFPNNSYFLSETLSELQKIDKYFTYFENINEMASSLHESLKNKTINIKLNNNKCELEINNPILNKKFKVNIPIKEKSIKNEISDIIPKIEELNLKVQKLEKENAELVAKVNYLMEKEK